MVSPEELPGSQPTEQRTREIRGGKVEPYLVGSLEEVPVGLVVEPESAE